MTDKEFNLLHEPWICVMTPDADVREVSILDAFRHAHEYRAISGELPTQNVAILRLLLAILHAVFGRCDIDGNYFDEDGESNALCDLKPKDAYDRWQSLWELGKFPMKPIEEYLSHYEERFYLFHPETPFYQVAGLNNGTDYKASKLNGEISESNNTNHAPKLISSRSGKTKEMLSYSEAARWLIHCMNFDDVVKESKENKTKVNIKNDSEKKSPGVGWLGKLGLIYATGNNLFETLLFNLVMLKQSGHDRWEKENPYWEHPPITLEKNYIGFPDNLSELYTIQSRRILLKRNDHRQVNGFRAISGDFTSLQDQFNEPMTTWRFNSKENQYYPMEHNASRQIWRDLESIISQNSNNHLPEIINWSNQIKEITGKKAFTFLTPSIEYGGGSQKSCINDIFNDSISFNVSLLSSEGEVWCKRIIEELKTTDELVAQLSEFAKNLAIAAGADPKGNIPKSKQYEYAMKAYYELDAAYRHWLESIDPEQNIDIDATMDNWWNIAKAKVREIGYELLLQYGANAFIGRELEINKKKKHISSSEEYKLFIINTSSRKSLKKSGGKK